MTESVKQTLSVVREQIDVGARNLESMGDPNARRISTSLQIDQIGGSKAHRTSLVESRSVNPLQEKAYIEQVTRLENNNIYTEFLSSLQSVIGGEKDPSVSRLVKTIDSFFTQAKILESSSGHSMRQAFINKAQEVSSAITDASEKVTDLRLEADKRLKQSAHSASGTIKAIFNLNQQMLISSSPIRLHDKRDQLVRELALNFDIKISYGAGGTVNIQAKSTGELLVGNDYYSQFSYGGVLTVDAIIENTDYPPLFINQFGGNGKQTHSRVFIGGSDDPTMSISGGKWAAFIDLRDKVLPQAGNTIKALGRNFSDKLNAIHNDGSPFPPKDYFESSLKVSRTEELEWGDPFTIHFVSKEGNQLRGGAGRLNSMTIDMKNLATTSLSGKATVSDLIKELNEKLDFAHSRPRAAIGGITDGSLIPVQVPGEYLLNNIQLRARGPVNPMDGNSFTFDLDLQGNSHFFSDIEILEARSEDIGGGNQQVVATDQLPASFRLDKDTNTATGKNIKVQGATAPRIITLRVRITGENGIVSEGTVSFPVNPLAVVNDRIAFDSTIPGATTGAFNPVPLTGHSGVARAKLVDDNGIEIDPNSGLSGKLVIATNDDSYRLVVQGGNFGSMFGFSDLFKFDDRIGELKVSQEIVDDVSKLSLGRAKRDDGVEMAHTVGDVKAKATLVFGGGVLAAGDTVTITGIGALPPVAFTFVAVLAVAPPNPDEVLLADGLFGPNGLVNRINAHPQLRGLVLATNNAGSLVIEAKAAGTGGNAITVASNLAGGATVDINGIGPLAVNVAQNLNAGNGIAGTNKVAASSVFSYTMKPLNQQVIEDLSKLQTELVTIAADGALPNTVATLSGLATIVTGLLSDVVNEAKIESDVATIVLERTNAQIKKESGISKEQEYLRVLDLARFMSTLSHLLSMLQNTLVKTEDIMFK